MKKVLAALLLALAIPAMANVTITATDAGSQQLAISFSTTDASVVRGIALTLTVTDGTVESFVSSDFNTFVDYAFTEGATYEIGMENQHPFALESDPGVETLPIAAAAPFAVSVGYLDQGGAQAGLTSGSVALIQLGIADDTTATVTITANAARGGAVVGDDLGTVDVQASATVEGPVGVTYNLTTTTGAGGTVTTPGIGTYPYAGGTVAPLVATANTDWFFWKWTGDTANIASTTSASTTITMNANAAVAASFTYSCQKFNFTKLVSGATDNAVTVADMNLLIGWVNTNKTGTTFAVSSTNPNWLPNGPIYNLTKLQGAADNAVTVSDLNLFIGFVNSRKTGTTFAVNCATCGC